MAIKIGCGSWADKEYTGILYPKGLSPKQRLATYATHFNHVEVNSTAYATPPRSRVQEWADQTPPGFTFNIKLHRAFSLGPKKAAEGGNLIERLLDAVEPLIKAKKLGAFLLLLTAEFSPEKRQLEEIDAVLKKLKRHTLAVELRNNAWVDRKNRKSTLEFFRERKIVFVSLDMPQIKGSTLMPALDEVTNPQLAYLRLHGRNPGYLEAKTAAEGHAYAYTPRELDEIARRVKGLAKKAKDVHVMANNHAEDFAPRTALALKKRLGV